MTAPLLVVAHEGYRNGATVVLRHLLPAVVEGCGRPVRVEVQTEGPLAGELRALATDDEPGATPALVLINSALAAGRLGRLPAGVPSLVYVHEVGEALDRLEPDAVDGLTRRADRVLCVSERARVDLVDLGVPADRIGILPPLIVGGPVAGADAAAARADLGIGPDEHLVLACGEAAWRKGADLFVDLARLLVHRSDARLVWVGRRNRAFAKQLDHDTDLAGATGRLRWHGEVEDPRPFLAAADLLVMTSREDPQPLVPLEAALAGTATVGLGGTGLDDLAAVGAARTVPFPDVPALAAAVVDLLGDVPARTSLVDRARRLVADGRSLGALAPQLVAELAALDRPERA